MFNALVDVWRSARARRAALDALRPLMARTLSAPSMAAPARWLEAYRVGFLASAISRIAFEACPAIGSEGLATVQTEVWGDLTGLAPNLVAERLLSLSLAGEPRFIDGCADALVFAAQLRVSGSTNPELPPGYHTAAALWDTFIGNDGADATQGLSA